MENMKKAQVEMKNKLERTNPKLARSERIISKFENSTRVIKNNARRKKRFKSFEYDLKEHQ